MLANEGFETEMHFTPSTAEECRENCLRHLRNSANHWHATFEEHRALVDDTSMVVVEEGQVG